VSIRAKIFLVFAGSVVAGFGLLAYWVTGDLRFRYSESFEEVMVDNSRLLAEQLSADWQRPADERFLPLQAAMLRASSQTFIAPIYSVVKTNTDIRIYVTDAAGRLLFDSRAGSKPGDDYSNWHDVAMTLHGVYGARTTDEVLPDANGKPATVTVAYVALNALYLYILPLDQVTSSERIAADAADALIGEGGAALMSALVAGSTFGALCGIVLVGPRVYYALARDGLLFRWVGIVHHRFETPHRAIVLQAIWSAALVATGTYRALFTRVVYTEWIFFAAMAIGLLLLRRRPGYRPAYRIAGGAVVPVIFAAAATFVAISQIVAEPANSAVGLLIVLAGLPVYAFTRSRAS